MKKKEIKNGSLIKCRKTGSVGIVVKKIDDYCFIVKVEGELKKWTMVRRKESSVKKRTFFEKMLSLFKN